MGRLRIVLVSAALVAGLAVGGTVRADEVDEDLPWWARPDYEEQADAIAAAVEAEPAEALPEPVDTPVDPSWWAGGPDAVLVLAGGEVPSEELADERADGSSSGEDAATADEDDGRNPLFNRAEGHRAGEDPAGTSGATGPDGQPLVEEDRDDRGTNECRRLPRQIARYKQQLDAGGLTRNGQAALGAQVARLEARLERRCPEAVPPSAMEQTVKTTVRLLAQAAKIAAKVARYMYGSPF